MYTTIFHPNQLLAAAQAARELEQDSTFQSEDMIHISELRGGAIRVETTSVTASRWVTKSGKILTERPQD